MRRKLLALTQVLMLTVAPVAIGSPGDYVLVSEVTTLQRQGVGTATASVTVINLTEQDAPVRITPAAPTSGCKAGIEPSSLQARRQETFLVTLTGCAVSGQDGIGLTLAVGSRRFPIVAILDTSPQPDWTLLSWFLIVIPIALTPVITAYVKWNRRWQLKGLVTGLKGLSGSWNFSESWASNVTVFAAAFAGLFGASDVLDAILGEEADSVLALITVAGAMAVGIVAAAPLVLHATRIGKEVTAFGLLSAALLTLVAAGGQLAVIVMAASRLQLGGAEDALPWLGGAGGILLAIYAYRTLLQILANPPGGEEEDGVEERVPLPATAALPEEVPPALQPAAAEVYRAMDAGMSVAETHDALYPDAPRFLKSAKAMRGDRPRRSAML